MLPRPCPTLPSGTIAREPGHDRIEEILIAERFCQELDGASLHRPHSHRNVAVRSDEDHWKVSVRRGKLTLEIEATSPWHSHVHHQAGWTVRSRVGTQIFGHTKTADFPVQLVRSSRPTELRNSASSSMIKTLGFASTQHPELKGHVFGPTTSYSQSVGKNSLF